MKRRRMNEAFGLDSIKSLFKHDEEEPEQGYVYKPHVDPQVAKEENKEFLDWLKHTFDMRVIRFKQREMANIMKSDNSLNIKKQIASSILGKAEEYMKQEKSLNESVDYVINNYLNSLLY